MIEQMFAQEQAPDVPKAFQTLYVEQAKVEADNKGDAYQLSFGISGVWEEGQIRLDRLNMSFAGSPKGKELPV